MTPRWPNSMPGEQICSTDICISGGLITAVPNGFLDMRSGGIALYSRL
jgi:hypothetical protein